MGTPKRTLNFGKHPNFGKRSPATRWFAPFQHKAGLKILEIGAQQGKSLHAWSRYFTDAAIIAGLAYGDRTDRVANNSKSWDKVVVFWGDQSKNETMQMLRGKGPWDIIIEDGSHYPPHMIFNFFSLWSSVEPGGLYVVEDLQTNYWKDGTVFYGYNMVGKGIAAGPEHSAVAKFKQLLRGT